MIMLALFGNLDLVELAVIAVGAILVFGKDLPGVAMKGAAQVMKLRRAVTRMWREAGIEDELRRVRWDLEREERELKAAADPKLLPSASPNPEVPDYSGAGEGGYDQASEDEPDDADWLEDSSSEGPSEEERRAHQGHDESGHGFSEHEEDGDAADSFSEGVEPRGPVVSDGDLDETAGDLSKGV